MAFQILKHRPARASSIMSASQHRCRASTAGPTRHRCEGILPQGSLERAWANTCNDPHERWGAHATTVEHKRREEATRRVHRAQGAGGTRRETREGTFRAQLTELDIGSLVDYCLTLLLLVIVCRVFVSFQLAGIWETKTLKSHKSRRPVLPGDCYPSTTLPFGIESAVQVMGPQEVSLRPSTGPQPHLHTGAGLPQHPNRGHRLSTGAQAPDRWSARDCRPHGAPRRPQCVE